MRGAVRPAARLEAVRLAGVVHRHLATGLSATEVAVLLGMGIGRVQQLTALGDWILGRRDDLPAAIR